MNTRREDQNLLKEAPEETAYRSNISIMQYIYRKSEYVCVPYE